MLTITLLVLLAGCGNPDTGDSNVADTDTDTDSDTDTDTDADVTFNVKLPVSGATVTVNEETVPCDASNVCTVSAPGDGTFAVTVTHPTDTFPVPKEVVVTDGVPSTPEVTYATGGCASDSTWDGTDWCTDWQMGEYLTTVQGLYCDQWDRCYDAVMGHADLDGDGVEEARFYLDGEGLDFNASGSVMSVFDGGEMIGYGSMESDLSVITFYYDAGDPDLLERIYTRVSN